MNVVSFVEAAPQIRDADLLLFRGRGSLSNAIQITGRSLHYHGGKAIWWRDSRGHPIRLFCFEMVAKVGRAYPLDLLVREYDGLIDVYHANANSISRYNRAGSARWTIENVPGRPYSRKGLLELAREHLPIIREVCHWWWPPNSDEDFQPGKSMFCSEACDAADHFGGGHKPVQELACNEVQPGNLETSDFYDYLFTLTP